MSAGNRKYPQRPPVYRDDKSAENKGRVWLFMLLCCLIFWAVLGYLVTITITD